LAAQFNDGPGIRIKMLHRQRDGVYFLDELGAYKVLESVATTPRNEYAYLVLRKRERFVDLPEEIVDHLWLLGIVAFVFLPENLIGIRVHNNAFTVVEPTSRPTIMLDGMEFTSWAGAWDPLSVDVLKALNPLSLIKV
jgi:hypothetical protein